MSDVPTVATCSLSSSSVDAGRNLRMTAAAKPNKGTAVTMRKALSAASWHCLSKHTPGTKAKTSRILAWHVNDCACLLLDLTGWRQSLRWGLWEDLLYQQAGSAAESVIRRTNDPLSRPQCVAGRICSEFKALLSIYVGTSHWRIQEA